MNSLNQIQTRDGTKNKNVVTARLPSETASVVKERAYTRTLFRAKNYVECVTRPFACTFAMKYDVIFYHLVRK